MKRLGFTGVPGSGKTTLARALASQCRTVPSIKHIELISEYARKYISKHGEIINIYEQFRVLEKQLEWEDSVDNGKVDLMITDSPVFLGFLYSLDLPKTNSKEIIFFNDIFKKMVRLNYPEPRYDIIFHLPPLIAPDNDGVRKAEHLDNAWRDKAELMIRSTMVIFKPGLFIDVNCKVEDRLDFCLNVIKSRV